ncbi:hypothetical protein [Prochlorococcus sp. MIT 1300]|uniref:hypothetical protein n=1 Tax=Prochlorococcus sp. MIT 1300 TaxID=3096218 RepID=UPI002A7499D8|nr:hypothetical protein [Prochlorococcus sp. MIT 1300]
MANEIEFSELFGLLNAIVEGEEKHLEAEQLLIDYREGKGSHSAIEELGKLFCNIGIMELYKYAGSRDIRYIANLEKEEWEKKEEEQEISLPYFLANAMISYTKENKVVDYLSKKWEERKRMVEKNIVSMAQYVTEGIIRLID